MATSSCCVKSVIFVGLVLVNLKIKSFIWLSLTETLKVKKAELNEDTQESVKKISEMGVEINTLTKSYLKVKQLNFW